MSVSEAAPGGRLAGLIALRDRLAMEIDSSESARDVAALSRQFTDVLSQIDELQGGAVSGAPKSPLDELMARRRDKAGKAG